MEGGKDAEFVKPGLEKVCDAPEEIQVTDHGAERTESFSSWPDAYRNVQRFLQVG